MAPRDRARSDSPGLVRQIRAAAQPRDALAALPQLAVAVLFAVTLAVHGRSLDFATSLAQTLALWVPDELAAIVVSAAVVWGLNELAPSLPVARRVVLAGVVIGLFALGGAVPFLRPLGLCLGARLMRWAAADPTSYDGAITTVETAFALALLLVLGLVQWLGLGAAIGPWLPGAAGGPVDAQRALVLASGVAYFAAVGSFAAIARPLATVPAAPARSVPSPPAE